MGILTQFFIDVKVIALICAPDFIGEGSGETEMAGIQT